MTCLALNTALTGFFRLEELGAARERGVGGRKGLFEAQASKSLSRKALIRSCDRIMQMTTTSWERLSEVP